MHRVSTPDRTVGESVTHDNIAGICNQKIDFEPTWQVWGRLVGNLELIQKRASGSQGRCGSVMLPGNGNL